MSFIELWQAGAVRAESPHNITNKDHSNWVDFRAGKFYIYKLREGDFLRGGLDLMVRRRS